MHRRNKIALVNVAWTLLQLAAGTAVLFILWRQFTQSMHVIHRDDTGGGSWSLLNEASTVIAPSRNVVVSLAQIKAATYTNTNHTALISTTPSSQSATHAQAAIAPVIAAQIIGYTNHKYVPLALKWYRRLLALGYSTAEVVIACTDRQAYDEILQQPNISSTSVEAVYIAAPDRRNMAHFRQVLHARLMHTRHKLEHNISVLLTDVDNIFMRHVPLAQLLQEVHPVTAVPYDVMHAHELHGIRNTCLTNKAFVVCGCHVWLRATAATRHYLDMVLAQCGRRGDGDKCDDQVADNDAMMVPGGALQIEWDVPPQSLALLPPPPPPRTAGLPHYRNVVDMNGLLVQEMRGYSRATHATIKIWDRNFATRWAGRPTYCPDSNTNWLAMPTGMVMNAKKLDKVAAKAYTLDLWVAWCNRHNGTLPQVNVVHKAQRQQQQLNTL